MKCSLLTGIYGVGSWEGVVEQEWDDTKLGHREDLRALKERLDQLAVVQGKSQVDVKKTFGKRVSEEMRTRLKAGIPGNKIMRGDFEWERALEIVQEVFVDSLCQGKQHQDFRGFGQGRGSRKAGGCLTFLLHLTEIKLKTTHEFVESQAAKAVVGQTIY